MPTSLVQLSNVRENFQKEENLSQNRTEQIKKYTYLQTCYIDTSKIPNPNDYVYSEPRHQTLII